MTPFITLAIIFAACGMKATISPMGELDTPEYNYQVGMKFLRAEQYDKAMESFKRAQGLKPKYAPAYEGMGLIYLAKGELNEAIQMMNESLKKDKEYVPAYIGKGRVLIAMGKLDDAIDEFNEALKLDAKHPDAHFHKGEAYMKQHKFSDAEYWFAKTLDIAPNYAKADSEWKRADMIKRAAPGTKVGAKIALVEKLTRADLAALFVEELKLDKHFKVKPVRTEKPTSIRSVPIAQDIKGHWAEGYINIALNIGAMEAYPNRLFMPDAPVRRGEFAMLVQNILLRAKGEEELASKFTSAPSPFPDVERGNYTLNAAVITTTRGLLEATVDEGEFKPSDPVSGAEALLALRKLRQVLE